MASSSQSGDDVLTGDSGNDQLYGDADPAQIFLPEASKFGADRFVFANGSGLDTIFDFENGRDLIDLTGFAGITLFDQVDAQATQVGADTVVDLGAAAGGGGDQDVLTLIGIVAADLDQTDFLFA